MTILLIFFHLSAFWGIFLLRKHQIYKEKDDIYQIYPVFKVFIHHYFEIMITFDVYNS